MLTKRTNILFDEELWKTLVLLAQRQKTSVGELVRTAVKREYFEQEEVKQIEEAIARIHKFREQYGKRLARGEDSIILIRKMRAERYGKSER